MTVKIYKHRLLFAVLLLFILVVTVACGDTSDMPAETTENTTTTPITTASVVTTTPTTTAPVTTSAPVTTTTPATTENPDDAWMDKVEFLREYSYPESAYDEETGKYNIQIFIQDIHNIGQTNAEKAFAERFNLFYNPDYDLWQILDFRFLAQATKEEIEMYARLEEVKEIWFNCEVYNE